MTWTLFRRGVASVLVLVAAGAMAGCSALDVSDPTAIEDSDLDNAAGADLLRDGALAQLYFALQSAALTSGMLTDELLSDPPAFYAQFGLISPDEILDRRESAQYEDLLVQGYTDPYALWQDVRRAATIAMPKLSAYAPPGAAKAHVGEMFAVRAFGTLRVAEDICPGFPLHDIMDLKPVYGQPLSTDQAFERALADFDSAVVYAADSARILNWARLGRARALLGLGRFAEAAAAANPVPTDYLANAEYLDEFGSGHTNTLSFGQFGDLTQSVADQEGGTGLDFVTAGDPRVETTRLGTANDGVRGIYAIGKYPDPSAPIVLASGIEARLIEAEGALDAGDPNWLTILNDLRATQISPPLSPLADPGTPDARVDLLFRERAFWLFATGHRLADLRRLIRQYGRTSESVFPTGAYRLGGVYETATSIPFAAAQQTPFDPAVTGCTSR